MRRWIVLGLLSLLGLLVAACAAVFWLGGRYDLGPLVAGRVTAALGRNVTIGSLHVTPGRWLLVKLHDFKLDNLPGGLRPVMAEATTVTAEVEAMSLLHRPLVIRRLDIEGLQVLLQRTADQAKNWHFGDTPKPAAGDAPKPAAGDTPKPAGPAPASRAGFPTLLDAHGAGDIVFLTSSGAQLRTHFDSLTIKTAGADQPVRLEATGSYNDAPVTIEAGLASIDTLRDASIPYPTDLLLTSGDTTLHFLGTMTDPLAIDGAHGTLALSAPTAAALFKIAGISSEISPSLLLSGNMVHEGPLWQLTEASGSLGDAAITAATLRLQEGPRGSPDEVTVDLAFDQLDINALVRPRGKTSGADADISIAVDQAPDTLVEAKLSARGLAYAGIRGTDVVLDASLTPGRVAVDDLSMTYAGAKVGAKGQIVPEPGSPGRGQMSAGVDLAGMDVQTLRRQLEVGAIPVQGRMDGRFAVEANGRTLNEATGAAHVSAVVAMNGGSVSREIIELASTDARTLFRTARGNTAISCMVGVIDLRGGAGTISPLRIRSAEGTIAGNGRFDLNRKTVDLVVASEARTTGFLALDVPMRVSGPLADPAIAPAKLTPQGRALLSAGDDVDRLLPSLQPFARRSPCLRVRR